MDDTKNSTDSNFSIPSNIQVTMTEPALQGVKQEDRTMIRNIIYLLHVCKHPARMCMSWNVNNTHSGYEVIGLLDPTKDFEIFHHELDLIKMGAPLRIKSISLCKTGEAMQVVIRVIPSGEPIMMTEMDIVTVQKKRRFFQS